MPHTEPQGIKSKAIAAACWVGLQGGKTFLGQQGLAPLHAQPLADSPWLLLISCAARQRLHLVAWHSHTAPAHWQHSDFCSKRQKAPLSQLVVKLSPEFNFLICFDFQNFDDAFQTSFEK